MVDINLHYSNIQNMGDLLNRIIFDKIFGKKIAYQHPDVADIIALGSILQQVYYPPLFRFTNEKPLYVWGTGFIQDPFSQPELALIKKPIRQLNVLALRGKFSKSYLENSLETEIECVLADPGLLADRVLVDIPKKQFSLGIIPHFIESDATVWQKIHDNYPNSIIINLVDNPLDVIRTIASCETVISSALHGLIVADAFGIPNRWVYYSDKVIGNGYKFRDYYSSYNLSVEPFVISNEKIPSLIDITEEYKITKSDVTKKQEELIDVFPFK